MKMEESPLEKNPTNIEDGVGIPGTSKGFSVMIIE